jgi:hypothetical protein
MLGDSLCDFMLFKHIKAALKAIALMRLTQGTKEPSVHLKLCLLGPEAHHDLLISRLCLCQLGFLGCNNFGNLSATTCRLQTIC